MAEPASTPTPTGVEEQHKIIGLKSHSDQDASSQTHHPGTLWFPEAGLGMIIHWGISSVHGGLDLSWGMIRNTHWDAEYEGKNKIAPREYIQLADRFNPQHYDPDRWIQAAAAAGFKYAVLTTRHCDGYSLWPSQHGDLGTHTHLGGLDLLQPFVDACHKHGLKVGFYYSPFDWYFNREYMAYDIAQMGTDTQPGSLVCNFDWQMAPLKAMPPEHLERYRAYERGQIMELLTRYGKIDIIWIDGVPESVTADEMRAIQPGIIVGRWPEGDFDTPECHLPRQKPSRWWEGCFIWNYHSWGYQKPDGYNPTGWMLHVLTHCRTWGGNLIINFAPTPDGTMPESYYERMAELKDWMEWGAESIVGIEAGPFPERCNVPVTVRGNKWYLHLLCPEEDDKGTSWFLHTIDPKYPVRQYQQQEKKAVLTQVHATPESIRLLRTGETIDFQLDGDHITISLPQEKSTLLDDVVVVDW